MKLVLASQNQKKLREMQEIFAGLGVEVISQAQLDLEIHVEETGETFAENALIKAKAVMEASGLPAVADDSGLAVDALGGAPGVYSARYGGEGLDDAGRYRLLLKEMEGESRRDCRFVCAIACAFPNGDVLEAEGACEGQVAREARGEGGFGYDPIFYLPQLRKSMAELQIREKHAISHRGKALELFVRRYRDYKQEK